MWVFTTAGFLAISAGAEPVPSLNVSGVDKESLDALADGIELIAGGNRPDVFESEGLWHVIGVLPEEFSAYMAHEIENYIDYGGELGFHNAVKESRGENWYNQMRKMDFHIGELPNERA